MHYQEVVVVHLAPEMGHDVLVLDLDDYKGLGAKVGKGGSLTINLVPSLLCIGWLGSKSICSWNRCRAVMIGSSPVGTWSLGGS